MATISRDDLLARKAELSQQIERNEATLNKARIETEQCVNNINALHGALQDVNFFLHLLDTKNGDEEEFNGVEVDPSEDIEYIAPETEQ